MINLVEGALHINVSGKDKQQEKIIDKINNSLHDYLTHITTLSEHLKKRQTLHQIFQKRNFSEIRKEPFFIEVKELREEVEKSFQAPLDGPIATKEALSKFKMSQSFTTGEEKHQFLSVKEHELMCPLRFLNSF